MLSHYSLDKLTVPKEYFGKPMLMDFSGRKYYVPEHVDLYLSHLFGDYMKLPSNDSQIQQMESVQYAFWYDESGKFVEVGIKPDNYSKM